MEQPITTTCDRCGVKIRLAPRRREDSWPIRLAKAPKGVCASCVVTQFLYNTYPPNLIIDEAGPELLLKPGIREAFLQSGLLDHCDLNIEQVNWQQVVDNWELPVDVKLSPTNPYRMGDSPRSYKHRPKGAPRPDVIERLRHEEKAKAEAKERRKKAVEELLRALGNENPEVEERGPGVFFSKGGKQVVDFGFGEIIGGEESDE